MKDNKIAISGWSVYTNITLNNFVEEYLASGVKNIICSDISRDGTLKGTSVELYRGIVKDFKDINFIASGGFAHISEIHLLNEIGVHGVIIGKAIYEQKITLKQLKQLATFNE